VSLSTTADFRTITLTPTLAEVSRRRIDEQVSGYLSQNPCPVNVASMLFQTNYLALVLRSNPYKVLLWDETLSQEPHELWSRFEVLNVVLRRDIICVVSEYKIYVYEFGGSFQVLLHLETAANPRGLCAISTGDPHEWTLVCPGPGRGQVRVQLGLDDSISSTISAHSLPVAALAINQSGSFVATASEQGTVIKVFSCTDGQQLYEFRRGTTAADISCINFRLDSKFLIVASASLTVHIFSLDEEPGRAKARMASVKSLRGGVDAVVASVASGCRAVAQFKIPDTGADVRVAGSPIVGPLCCFSKMDGNRIFVVHINGLVYEAFFDPTRTDSLIPQECTFTGASAYFQARPDFVVSTNSTTTTVPSSDQEDNWNLL
jgi:hypothetical protein